MDDPFNYKLYHDTRHKPEKEGQYPIKLVITEKFSISEKHPYGKRKHKSLDFFCSEDVFQALFPEYSKRKENKLLQKDIKNIKSENEDMFSSLTMMLSKIETVKKQKTAYTLKDLLNEISTGSGSINIKYYYFNRIDELNRDHQFSTADRFKYSYLSLKKFKEDKLKDIGEITFFEINKKWLTDYEKYMLSNNRSLDTIRGYLKDLSVIFNIAIKDKKCPLTHEKFPFGNSHGSYIIKENVSKNNKVLTPDEFEKFKAFKCQTFNQLQAKEFFLFSYYCGGINMVDIVNLTNDKLFLDDEEPYFIYSRQKNLNRKKQRSIQIPLDEFTTSVINKYRGSGKYVFNILEGRLSELDKVKKRKNFTSKILKQLKKIAKIIDIDEGLCMGMARHMVFSYMNESADFQSSEIVETALHSKITTTQNYLAKFRKDKVKEIFKKIRK